MEYPFKAVCVNGGGWCYDKEFLFGLFKMTFNSTGPVKDEVVTVIGEYSDDGENYYVLKGYSEDIDDGYLSSCFVPIQENFQAITYEKVMEKESSLILSN